MVDQSQRFKTVDDPKTIGGYYEKNSNVDGRKLGVIKKMRVEAGEGSS